MVTKLLRSSLPLLFAGALFACTSEEPVVGDEQNQTEINGKSPEAFFEQFLYVKVKPLDHRYPTTPSAEKLADTGLHYEFTLYLRDDGTFTFDYAEMKQKSSSEYVWEDEIEGQKGSWSIRGDELVLSGVGSATGVQYNGKDALDLEFDHDLITPGLKGDSAILTMVKSTWGPDGND